MSSCGFRTPNQRGRSILALCLLSASVLAPFGAARPMRRIREGTWGGEHVRIKVAGDSVTIEYDCAHGTINGPFCWLIPLAGSPLVELTSESMEARSVARTC